MKQLFATKPLTEFDRLLKTFKQTHELADLEKLLSYCCKHLDIRHFIEINWFLFDIQGKEYIKQESHTKLLYSFALLMMPLVCFASCQTNWLNMEYNSPLC
jgi:hypothetical protein